MRSRRSPAPPARRRAGELEGDVLAALWSADRPLVPSEVQAAVADDLAYTTVMTTLVRLHEKGLIERTKLGRAYAYRPVVAEAEVVADQVRRLLAHGGDRTAVIRGLLDGLRPDDEAVLRELLAQTDRARRAQGR